jgi:hypothetical protein
MSKLSDLKDKIESIPGKQRRKNLVSTLAQYSQTTLGARDTLKKTAQVERYARVVFPNEDFQRVAESSRKAANVARRLHRKLNGKAEAVELKSSNDQFINLVDYARASQTALKDRWSQLLTKKVADFDNLVRTASGANLEGSRALVQTLDRLRTRTGDLPKSEQDARNVAADLKSLDESVSTLGLKGKAGEFLAAASAGSGNPRDLCDPEVTEFIERNNLWGLLTVKLG